MNEAANEVELLRQVGKNLGLYRIIKRLRNKVRCLEQANAAASLLSTESRDHKPVPAGVSGEHLRCLLQHNPNS